MDTGVVKALLEKYYEGKTSLAEEQILKEYFSQKEVPPELETDREVFQIFLESSRTEVLGEDFDNQVLDLIRSQEFRLRGQKRWIYTLSGIAAGFTILFATWFLVVEQRLNLNTEGSFEMMAIQDPDLALEETMKALYMVSEVFNRGTGQLSGLAKLEEGKSKMQALAKFNQAAGELQSLGKFNEVEQLITSKK